MVARLHIIPCLTLGMGDSRGVERDKKNVDNILRHIANINSIHAICILLKPNEARLTILFKYCIQQLLAHLHKDAIHNILFCFTHARSNFYKPGNTLTILRSELLNRGVGIHLNKDNIYCFDNEAFRFLACIKNGVTFPEKVIDEFASSWTHAVNEKERMFKHIMGLTPHKVHGTLALNEARRLIIQISSR